MVGKHALANILVAAALLAGAPLPASAQCRLCSTPTTEPDEAPDGDRIQLQVGAVLDFDRLVLMGAGNGAATLSPNGDRRASGTVATISSRAMVGSISVHGEPGRALKIGLPPRITLYSINGASIAVDDIESDLAGLPKLDGAGNLTFRFGGKLTVSGDAEGEYRGDVPIDVDYL